MMPMSRRKEPEEKAAVKQIIFILSVIAIVSLITIWAVNLLMIDSIKIYELGINVDNLAGFNVSSSENFLQFGTSKPGSIVSRYLIFNNTEGKSSKVIMKSYGDIKEWVAVSENNFVLEGNQNKSIKINVAIPKDADYGAYSGELKIIFMRKFK